jgi:hypothetical protein
MHCRFGTACTLYCMCTTYYNQASNPYMLLNRAASLLTAGSCPPVGGFKVNGNTLLANEATNLCYVAQSTVPFLKGDRNTRIQTAARGLWWSMKEGVLKIHPASGAPTKDNPNVFSYSLCQTASGDVNLGPADICTTSSVWQVGIAAVQVSDTLSL